MRKYGYNRPSATLYVRRQTVRKKRPSFFFKFFLFLFLILGIGGGGYLGARYVYRVVKSAQLTNWHVKAVAVSGLDGALEKEIFTTAAAFEGKPFSFADSEKLQQQFVKQYPMLRHVSVTRGLLSGKLKVSAKRREPVAQFVLPDQTRKYIDQDSRVYADPNGPQNVPQVSLVGDVPDQLKPSFVELVQDVLKLKKSLPFESLEFDLQQNTVTLRLPDRSVVSFGPATELKSKARRAAQIMDLVRQKYQQPATVNFEFFEQGKVFLTLSAH